MTTATKASKSVTCDCPKCGGSGFIAAFSGIANGTCFTCMGSGKKTYKAGLPKLPPINDYALGLVNQILNGTDEEFAKMSYSQLLNLRDVAHSGGSVMKAYPQLHKFWFDNFDCHFQFRQNERLERLGYAT